MNHTTRNLRIRHRIAAAATALLVAGTGIALAAGPAAATPPSSHAAGWLTRSSAGTVTSWGTPGTHVTLFGPLSGRYTATFHNVAGAFGAPSVAPGNQHPGAICSIDAYGNVGNDLDVTFHCSVNGGATATDFTVTYTSIAGATEGWVDADQAGFNGVYHPALRYNAVSADVTVAHNTTYAGEYLITYPGLVTLPSFGSTTATPVTSGDGHCTTGAELWNDRTVVDVHCFDAAGAPADMHFVSHIVGQRAVLATPTPKSAWAIYPNFSQHGRFVPTQAERYASNGQKASINHTAKGKYTFTFTNLAAAAGRGAQAFASGGPGSADVRCGAVASTKAKDAVVTVTCTDKSATPTDATVTANFFGI